MTDKLAIGKVIKMPCMRSGVCKYPKENVLVTKAALDFMAASAIGIPVIIDHPNEKITDESIKNMPVVGRVADLHYIEADEIWLAHFVVDTAEAVQLLENGYGVSTAWYGEKYGPGGTYNNVPFDRELIEGRYEHLAIVLSPRYEMAVDPIFVNAKDGQIEPSKDIIKTDQSKGSISMFGKIFRKSVSREEIMANANDDLVVEVDGKEMSLKAVIELAARKDMPMINSAIDIEGETVAIKDLVELYLNSKKKKNESEEKEDDEKEKKEEKEEMKENEDKEDEEKEKKDEKKENASDEEKAKTNSKFEEIDTAHVNGMAFDPAKQMGIHERVNLGKSRYGSGK